MPLSSCLCQLSPCSSARYMLTKKASSKENRYFVARGMVGGRNDCIKADASVCITSLRDSSTHDCIAPDFLFVYLSADSLDSFGM
mmetsp:Transcript_15457/g.26182  ORF Transcript_15457/g.26182 Transcript_15457/m.26182 type:complete len:85 (-) Transcript_15457:96-350(-)